MRHLLGTLLVNGVLPSRQIKITHEVGETGLEKGRAWSPGWPGSHTRPGKARDSSGPVASDQQRVTTVSLPVARPEPGPPLQLPLLLKIFLFNHWLSGLTREAQGSHPLRTPLPRGPGSPGWADAARGPCVPGPGAQAGVTGLLGCGPAQAWPGRLGAWEQLGSNWC